MFSKNSSRPYIVELIFFIWISASLLFIAGCAANVSSHKSDPEELRDKWGIEITSLRMTAAEHMVDFRYRVLDPDKAETLFVRKNKPYLIDQKSQKVLSVPVPAKIGPLRTSDPPKKDRIYWMFFGNAGGLVHSGSKVTVVIGEFRAENLVVQ